MRAPITRASAHAPLIAVPLAAWALAAWTRGDAADTLLHTSWLLVIVAPLSGVARVAWRDAGATGWTVMTSLGVSVGLAIAASAVLTLGVIDNASMGFVMRSHAVMASVALALAACGALMATAFANELDAAAASVALALLAAGGVLFAGTWSGLAPRAVLDGLLAASPFIAMASAADIDVMRLDLFYTISPLAHLGVDYPAWYLTGAGYAVIATVCWSAVGLRDRQSRPAPAVTRNFMHRGSVRVIVLCAAVLIGPSAALAQSARVMRTPDGLTPETHKQLVDSLNKAEAYLKKQQASNGTFDPNPGITALATTALLKQPGSSKPAQVKALTPALDSLTKLAKPDGGIYERVIPHYITAVSVSALVAAGRPADRPIIDRARQYLVDNLLDEGEGVAKTDFWYGGMGYGATTRADGRRADMISLGYALQAMKDADVPENDAVWQKALTFLQRTQNNSETNDQKWAGNDGGFVYYPGFSYHADGGTKSYGSVSYTGLMSYSWANLSKADARVKGVQKWISDNYTVDENPGMGQKTVYYYYMVFAKALAAMDEPVIVDSRGRRHNWREELGRKLLSLQKPEGYWVNTVPDEMQDNKVLVTAFTMAAVQAILQ